MSDVHIFTDGIPQRINAAYFRARYGQNFPDLLAAGTDTFLATCIEDIYTLFIGVQNLWDKQRSSDVYYDKTRMCYGLLLAWYIADMYPNYAIGVISSGGIPVKAKSVGGIKISFGTPDGEGINHNKTYRDALSPLKSNPFGYKAYMMLKNASKNAYILGRIES